MCGLYVSSVITIVASHSECSANSILRAVCISIFCITVKDLRIFFKSLRMDNVRQVL